MVNCEYCQDAALVEFKKNLELDKNANSYCTELEADACFAGTDGWQKTATILKTERDNAIRECDKWRIVAESNETAYRETLNLLIEARLELATKATLIETQSKYVEMYKAMSFAAFQEGFKAAQERA